ncbi:MAG: hypothetical protein V4850_25135 [Myxococcota bacterium]
MSLSPSLDDARALLGLDRGDLMKRLGASDADLHYAEYGPSDDLEAVQAPPPVAGTVFLDNGRVVLVHLYRGFNPPAAPTIFGAMRPQTLSAFESGATRLRSSAGKLFNHYVDPARGLAWSADEEEITSIEVFEPTDLESYKARFYEDPGPFYK